MTIFKQFARTAYVKILILFTIFNALFLFARNLAAGNSDYNFLLWNLFLGFLPMAFATLSRDEKIFRSGPLFFGAGFLWLLFYPNAPYMITDLIHVDNATGSVLYDALMIFSFAMQSLFFGFFSLKLMEATVLERYGKGATKTFLYLSILLSSFGIYLGRILRLNSWDVFTHPLQTAGEILSHLFPIGANVSTYAMIFVFTMIQILLFESMKDLENVQ